MYYIHAPTECLIHYHDIHSIDFDEGSHYTAIGPMLMEHTHLTMFPIILK